MYAVRNHGHDISLSTRMNKPITSNNYVGIDEELSVSYF